MSAPSKKYDEEQLRKIGKSYVESNLSVREVAENFGVSPSTVSTAKDVYLAFQEGKETGKNQKQREMDEKVNRLEERLEKLSTQSNEYQANDPSEIDPQDYVNNPEQGKIMEEKNEEEESGWGWIVVGLGVLVGAGSVIFRDLTE